MSPAHPLPPNVTDANLGRMKRPVALLLVVGALATPTAARADISWNDGPDLVTTAGRTISPTWEMRAAIVTARTYWRSGGCPTIRFRWATIARGSDSRGNVAYAFPDGTCRVYIDERWLNSAPSGEVLCTVIVHEYGHLSGHDHAIGPTRQDPESVMTVSPHIPSLCRERTFALAVERVRARWSTKRKPGVRKDERWCRKHQLQCWDRYPDLADAALEPMGAALRS